MLCMVCAWQICANGSLHLLFLVPFSHYHVLAMEVNVEVYLEKSLCDPRNLHQPQIDDARQTRCEIQAQNRQTSFRCRARLQQTATCHTAVPFIHLPATQHMLFSCRRGVKPEAR